MRYAFDIGGVLSKYPAECVDLVREIPICDLYIITDMERASALQSLYDNKLDYFFYPHNVLSADYQTYGDAAKAILMREYKIDVMIDDHMGYLVWPFSEPAPLRLLVMPDCRRPYYDPDWKINSGPFGHTFFNG